VISTPIAAIKRLTATNGHDAPPIPAPLVWRRIGALVSRHCELMRATNDTAHEAIDELCQLYSYAAYRSAATVVEMDQARDTLIPPDKFPAAYREILDNYQAVFLSRVSEVTTAASAHIVEQAGSGAAARSQ